MECKRCGRATKPTTEFYFPSQLNGRGQNSWCRFCLTAYNRENRHKYRDRDRAYNKKRYGLGLDVEYRKRWKDERYAKLNAIKAATPCMDCGNFFPPVCMDYDHRDSSTKVADVASLVGAKKKSWNIVLEEISKCDLVCANCHRIRTAVRTRDKSVPYHRTAQQQTTG